MPEEGKKSGVFAQIVIAVVIAMCVGGTSPWWFRELFPSKPDKTGTVEAEHSDPGLSNSKSISQLDQPDLEKRQKQLEEELANLKREQQKPTPARQVKSQINLSGTWRGGGSSFGFGRRDSKSDRCN